MTRAAAAGVVKTAVPTRSATVMTSAKAGTPSAKITIDGPAPINRSARSARRVAASRSRRFASYAPITWMRLRWPISAADAAASWRTTALLSRPTIQASDSASLFASCNRVTLTCRIRLPGSDQLVQRARVARRDHRVAQRTVAEKLRQLRKNLQMLLGGLLGHQQDEHQVHRLAVRAVERDRLRQARERAECFLQPLDPPVRDRNALAEARRAETLAVEQAVEDQVAGDSVVVLEQQADLFEQALLAGYRQIEHDIARRQQLGD